MNAVWTFDFSPLRVAAAMALVLGTLSLSILQYRRGGRRRGEGIVEAIRFVAAAMLAFTFLKPERVRQVREHERPEVVVLCDRSGSMTTRDVVTPEGVSTRSEWLDATCRPDLPRWSALQSRYRLRLEQFPAAPPNGTPPDQIGTNLHEPLDRLAREGVAPRAVLLLSDGDWNLGPPPVLAASRLQTLDVPVFAVVVGADRPLPDIELGGVRAPAYALADEYLNLPFTARSFLNEPATVNVVLLEEGIERARRAITLPAMAQYSSAIGFAPAQEGDRLFTVRLVPVDGESRTDNNEQTFRMAVRREIIRVLIVETEPRWEYRYLRNAALRDPGVEVRTLLLHPHLGPGGGLGYLPAFPATREELSRFDVLFLGDVGKGTGGLTEEQAQWVREVVESQASGLVFLPGVSGRWISLATGPLAPLLPVEIEVDRPRGHGQAVESRLQLTARGREHLLTMLAPSPDQNARIWAGLPGFFWYAGVARARPGAEVLAVHAQARNEHGRIPLLVASTFGSGKTLFMGMDSAWRWRRGVEDLYHYRFWSQVFRWMAHQRRMAHAEGLRFFYAPESPKRGDRLLVHATPLDASGFPIAGATVEARWVAPSGAETRFVLRPIEGAWAAYQGGADLREGGEFKLEVRCRETDRRAETRFLVSAPSIEPVGRPARPEVLREIAAITGGRCGRAEELDELVEELIALPPPAPRRAVLRWWCHPAWLVALATIWGLYWMGRKGLGRI